MTRVVTDRCTYIIDTDPRCGRNVGHAGTHQTKSEMTRRKMAAQHTRAQAASGKRQIPVISTVRLRDGVWEYRCRDCSKKGGVIWWPLTDEFWNPRNLTRCRACHKELRDKYNRARPSDPEYMRRYREETKEARAIKQAMYYQAHRQESLEYHRAYRRVKKDRLNQLARERHARRREQAA